MWPPEAVSFPKDTMSEEPLRRVLVEDIPSLVACHHTVVAVQSADLAPVHSSRVNRSPNNSTMEKKVVGDASHLPEKRTSEIDATHPCLSGSASGLASELRDKLSFKNGVMNGMKIGTTDAEVHVPAVKSAKSVVLDEQCSESSHESTSKSDINGTVCNGHTVSEATSSNSIAISDTFSINSEKSSDSSHSFSGARPRTRNASNSSHSTQAKSDVDLSSTSESLIAPEICISPVSTSVDDDLKVDYIKSHKTKGDSRQLSILHGLWNCMKSLHPSLPVVPMNQLPIFGLPFKLFDLLDNICVVSSSLPA
ncbi:hypothetical protein SK128_007696 [Halocaridina rubra]|uniref:Uncharacterized protein n=1 Tax=Halocaridina rubra TaxID=373956 RepID=A0AAN8WVW7_HALRR